jgi:DNA recombination protein RmuC
MSGIWIVAAAVVFLSAGIGVGLALRRQAGAAALAAAVAAARAEEQATAGAAREAERAREVERVSELARARAELEAAERRHGEAARELEGLRKRAEELAGEARRTAEERTRLEAQLAAERKAATERAADAERSREAVRAEIEKLAGRVLDEKGKAILERSQEGLRALLGPVGEKLKAFEEKIEKTYVEENRDRASLLREIRLLQDAQKTLSKQADGLSRALTGDSKAQGDWGEMMLESLLQTAGLVEGQQYDLQESHVDEEGGRKRPDAIVKLPGHRAIVVDAKCSLTAFVEAMHAVDPEAREEALDRHLASLRAHVKGLAGKNYTAVLAQRTLDFVFLFVPNEAAFHAALARAPALCEEALAQRVALCSPTTLLAVLRTVEHVWRSEKQSANAQKIAEEAGKLLDKLSDFVGDLDQVGVRLGQAQQSFHEAKAKLETGRGSAMKKAQAIAELGARVKPDKKARLLRAAGDEGEEEPAQPSLLPVDDSPRGGGAASA